MDRITRLEILAHATRWASNMLVEAVGNHGPCLEPETRATFRNATRAIQAAVDAVSSDLLRAEHDKEAG